MNGQEGLALRCERLSKWFPALEARGALREAVGRPAGRASSQLALDEVDLEVPSGQTLGIIGPNGAGKSTLLRIIAGIAQPSSGAIEAQGTVRAVIELGAGFHPDLTGVENLRCLGVLQGRTRRQTDASVEEVVSFAGIGDAIHLPLKQYSLGMQARLAFAAVTQQRPDVLVVDEVLVVGDQAFQLRCLERIEHMVAAGTTLVFVSHEMPMVSAMCERVVHLRRGRIVDDGPAREVIERYRSRSSSVLARAEATPVLVRDVGVRSGQTGANSLELWMELDVHGPVREPAIGLDVVLPMVDPDNVVSSSTEPLPAFDHPGCYRVVGATESIGYAGRDMRFVLSIVDQATRQVLDGGSAHAEFVGDLTGLRLGPLGAGSTIPVHCRVQPDEPDSSPTRTTRVGRLRDASPVVALQGVSKRYRSKSRGSTVRPLVPGAMGRTRRTDVVALDDVDLEVGRGEAVGIIGPNASGKTTLLRVVAGVTEPDAGVVRTEGRVLSLLELGAGFHPDLSGLENLRVSGRLHRVRPAEWDACLEDAVAFSGLGDAVHQPLKTYSTGMMARLAMSMALAAPTDVVLIDEVLSVGDQEFRRAAIQRLGERCRSGLTVLFVSHDLQVVEQVCERVVRLDRGRCIADGSADDVIGGYGGRGWAGGVHDAESGIRVRRLELSRHHIATGGRLVVGGRLEVDEPSPTAVLEFALRSPLPDRDVALTLEERAAMSALMTTLVPAGRELARPGVHHFECTLDADHLVGEVDVVVSVIEPDRQVVLSEVWEQLVIGAPAPGAHLTFEPGIRWSIVVQTPGAVPGAGNLRDLPQQATGAVLGEREHGPRTS